MLMEITPLLSAYIVMGCATDSLISSKYLSNHKAWVVACEKAINLVFIVDRTTVSCLFVFQETGPPTITKNFAFY